MYGTADFSSPRTIGVGLVVFSALVFSTAGLFTKGVQAGAWDVIFWRGLFAALFTIAYALWSGTFRANFVEMGGSGWAAALVGASGTAAFILAFKLTTIANVSLIYAATPILAAFLAWAWVGERLNKFILMGCAVAFAGMAVIVGGSVGGISLRGDLLAMWMTSAMAILVVLYRRYPRTPAAGPAVLSSLMLLPFGLALGTPLADPSSEIIIMVAFGLVFAFGSVTLAEGARRVPAGETALLSTLEAPIAPVLAWLAFAELPSFATIIGGLLILASVVGTQIAHGLGRSPT